MKRDKSLIFYYANYSNPFSEEESPRYVLVGVSRVKDIGDRLVYDEATEYIRERYADGIIWARNVSSHYPNQGIRLPYHRYRNDTEALERFAIFPENPRTCKYGARLLTNDDAIGLLEQFLSAVYELKDMEDKSENWQVREQWLLGLLAELWNKRGALSRTFKRHASSWRRQGHRTGTQAGRGGKIKRSSQTFFQGT